MKNTRRSNKKQGKNTRRKSGGTIYYPPGDIRKSYYFYVREDAKVKRLNNYLKENLNTRFTEHQVGKHNKTFITGQLTSGLIPGDLIVILYQANITSLGVKLHLVDSVDPEKDNFKYFTLGLSDKLEYNDYLDKSTYATGLKKLYNLTLGNLSKLGRLGYGHDYYTAACTQNELASCYKYDLMFTAGMTGIEVQGNYYKDFSAISMSSGFVLSDKIWILREKYRTGTRVLGDISKPAMDSVIRNYESNEQSLFVFIKLFYAAKKALDNSYYVTKLPNYIQGLGFGLSVLMKNPMWQECFTPALKKYISETIFKYDELKIINKNVNDLENKKIDMMILCCSDELSNYKIFNILKDNTNKNKGWSFLKKKKYLKYLIQIR